MDKSFHGQVFSGAARSPFGSRTPQSSASSVISGRKSVGLGSLKKASGPGHYSISGRSTQSLSGIRSEGDAIVESYGFQLPVLVNEALTFSDRSSSISINCSSNGWAWAIHGRRLLIWQYRDNRITSPKQSETPKAVHRRTTIAQCRELTLPHCDIGHKASLVTVFQPDGQQMASCLAVSPTGDARYWSSIAHDGSSIDSFGILDGQEFDYLLPVPPQGYILVTTTCTLVFLQLQIVNGRHVIQHRTVKAPTGFFGGIGKKFASIIIGMNSGNDKENKFVKIGGEKVSDSEWLVTVLADGWIQKWSFINQVHDQLLFEDNDVTRKILDEFYQRYWSVRAENPEMYVNLLDMQLNGDKVYILAGAVNTAHSPQMHYGIVVLKRETDSFHVETFMPLKLYQFYSPNTEQSCLSFRFIFCRSHIYIYGERSIYLISIANISSGDVEAEKIELQAQDDEILCAAVCGHLPLFFSRNNGLLCITSQDFDSNELHNATYSMDSLAHPFSETYNHSAIAQNITMNNLPMYNLNPDEIFNAGNDEVYKLKAAFIYHIQKQSAMCANVLKGLVPDDIGLDELDSQLDRTIVTIVEGLAEDIPATDPRWEQYGNNSKYSLGSSSSLQTLTQLKEKNSALNLFVDFLHSTGLWDKMNAVTYHGVIKPTCYVVSDINEKIVAAITLKLVPAKLSKLVDEAIEKATSLKKEYKLGNLTAQDVFYVKLNSFERIFQALCEVADAKIVSLHPQSLTAAFLSDVNSIVISILKEVMKFRDLNTAKYTLPADKLNIYEYLPWTAISGSDGVRDCLAHLVNISVKYGIRSTGEPELKSQLYTQILALIDYILDGRKSYLESVKDNDKYGVLLQQYETQRRNLIGILIEDEKYTLAAKLAEKYLDFHSLVMICDKTRDQDRLDGYIEKYQEYDFSQFAINWHLRQNRQAEVFERFKGNQAALSQFMEDHPSLGWIQLIFNGEFDRASKVLFKLGLDEEEFVARKRTILSLAKLSSLAADSDLTNQISDITGELDVVEYQEQINNKVLAHFGFNTDNPKVLKVEEMINLFICAENDSADATDFRKALELLQYLEEPFETKHRIWCQAIKRDIWTGVDPNLALEFLRSTIFLQLVELCIQMDGDAEVFLPPLDELLQSTLLEDLVREKTFQYLLKLAYEHIAEVLSKNCNNR